MRIANHADRAVLLITDSTGVDIHTASDGRFGPDLGSVYENWSAFAAWAQARAASLGAVQIDRSALGSPSPRPRQVFAIGLNYGAHRAEAGYKAVTEMPPVFTKFVSALTGPDTVVALPAEGKVDWEVELVVVIGTEAKNVEADSAWNHVAGLSIGQDFSERITQNAGQAPQFSLGKSYEGFSPVGPWLVTPDEFADPDDIKLGCSIDGEQMQNGTTSDMLYSVPRLIESLSKIVRLMPGDMIFTGTPSGVGIGRSPQRFLAPGESLVTWIEGIGEIKQSFVAA
jgi:2-keto-4-pentenoate hydratase/2-oxohepta-3-ene-1,7-dioic acid hydratase in catechol pathway